MFIVAPALLMVFAGEVTMGSDEVSPNFILINSSLRAEPIEILAMSEERIQYTFDGLERYRPRAEVVAIVRAKCTTNREPNAMVELVDGQRWVGSWGTGGRVADGDRVVIRHDYFGQLETPLEDIVRARPRYGGKLPSLDDLKAAEGDRVYFTNGDMQEGFVLALGNPTIIEDQDGQETTVGLENVQSVGLLNPTQPPQGTRLWLVDGSIFEISSITIKGHTAEVRKDPSGEPVWIGLEYIEAIVFDASGFIPLADVSVGEMRGEGWMSTVEPPRLVDLNAPGGLRDIELTGPGEVDFELPSGVTTFATEASVPRYALGWADFRFVLLVDGGVIGEWVLNDRHDHEAIVLDIPPGAQTLTLRIEEGQRGPVQNILRLGRPRLHRR